MSNLILCICIAVLAYVFGIIGYKTAQMKHKIDILNEIMDNLYGEMVINVRDPEKDIYRLEFNKPVNQMLKDDFIVFSVRIEQ